MIAFNSLKMISFKNITITFILGFFSRQAAEPVTETVKPRQTSE